MKKPSVWVICRRLEDLVGETTADIVAVRIALLLQRAGFDITFCVVESPDPIDGCIHLASLLTPIGIGFVALHLPRDPVGLLSLELMTRLNRSGPSTALFVGCSELAYFSVVARRTLTGLLATSIISCVFDPSSSHRRFGGQFLNRPESLLEQFIEEAVVKDADCVLPLNDVACEWVGSLVAERKKKHVVLPASPVSSFQHLSDASLEFDLRRSIALCGITSFVGVRRALDIILYLAVDRSPSSHCEVVLVGLPKDRASISELLDSAILVSQASGIRLSFVATSDYLASQKSQSLRSDFGIWLDPSPQGLDTLLELVSVGALSRVVNDVAYRALFTGAATGLLCPPDVSSLLDDSVVTARGVEILIAASEQISVNLVISAERLIECVQAGSAIQALQPFVLGYSPKVSICISHFNRPALLDQAIRSIEAQDYSNIELLIVDDASPSASTQVYLDDLEKRLDLRGWKLLRNDVEKWQQESRNTAARAATGDYIFIMDDDNCARPDEIRSLVTVAEYLKIPIVRCLQSNFFGDEYPRQDTDERDVEFFPVGGPLSLGTMWNVFGDVNVLYKRETFLDLGGFTPTNGLGCEDFEIGIRAEMSGHASITIPRVLYDYRLSESNMAKSMNNKRLYDSHARLARLYEAEVPSALGPVYRLLNEQFHRIWQRDGHAYWRRENPTDGSFKAKARFRRDIVGDEASYLLSGMLLDDSALSSAERLVDRLLINDPLNRRLRALKLAILFRKGDVLLADSYRADDLLEAVGDLSSRGLLGGAC